MHQPREGIQDPQQQGPAPSSSRRSRSSAKPRPTVPASVLPDYLAEMDRSRNPHIPVMIRVIIGLGLRESEVLGMRWEWACGTAKILAGMPAPSGIASWGRLDYP